MRFFWQYAKTRRIPIGIFLLFGVVFAVSFWLYRLPPEAVLYPFLLCCLIGVGILTADFLRVQKKHRALLRRIAEPHCEKIPLPPDTVAEEDYEELIARLGTALDEEQAQQTARYREMVDYYTVWAHQIKTPLSSMKLALHNEDSALARRLSSDVFRTEQYVEMVLAFLRLGSDSTDYVFRHHSLDGLIRDSVRKFAPEFIDRRLTLTYEPADGEIVTDEKWFSFVLEQILSNALKYTRQGGITVRQEGDTLLITDTGIGIAAADLPRIFEKGYTGRNGRTDRSASGLGLYLCRQVCDRLGIGIALHSQIGQGTTVELDLRQKNTVVE